MNSEMITTSLGTLKVNSDGKLNELKRISRNAISKFRKARDVSEQTTPSISTIGEEDKLLQVLGLLSTDEDSESDIDIEVAPKRKTKNLVAYLGGPDLGLNSIGRSSIGNTSRRISKHAETVSLHSQSPIDDVCGDSITETDLVNVSLSENVPNVTDYHEAVQSPEVKVPKDVEVIQSTLELLPLSKTKDLCKYLGAASPTDLAQPVQSQKAKANRISLKRKAENVKCMNEILKDSSPDVQRALMMVQHHIHSPDVEPRQSATSFVNIDEKKERLQVIASKATRKVRNALKLIQSHAKSWHKPIESSKVPPLLQLETIEIKSVVEQIEQFKRESLLMVKGLPSTQSIPGGPKPFKKPFFDETRNYRIIDLIRTPRYRWVDLFVEAGESKDSNETLNTSAPSPEKYEQLTPEFIQEMIHGNSSRVIELETVTKDIPQSPQKTEKQKFKIDVDQIINTILTDLDFKRDIFRDELWKLPNKEAFPELFGQEVETTLQQTAQSDKGSLNESLPCSEVDLLTLDFADMTSTNGSEEGVEDGKEHPLQTMPLHRRCFTQFQNSKQGIAGRLRTSVSVQNTFGFNQLQHLNKVIQEETKGMEQLRRVNAVLVENEKSDRGGALEFIKQLASSIPSLSRIRTSFTAGSKIESETSIPSMTDSPEDSNRPELIKYMFQHHGREIFVDGLGAEEMVSATRLVHDASEQLSISSISELLTDAIETNIKPQYSS